ncbi:MAG: PAS domain-containing sensor histidine kinase [Planctomycetes bacterium]|nr:PAS domain-containing sensor histidine kinase [Planctomycetota bacterium]
MNSTVSLPDVFATLAFLTGVGGGVVTAWLAPRRWSPATLGLWLGYTLLVASGVLAVGETGAAERPWAGPLASAAVVALALGGVFSVLDLRAREKRSRMAHADAETLRRDIDRLNGINVRLEDEAQDLRRRARAGDEQRSGSGVALEATLTRQRRALEAASAQGRRHRAVFDGAVEGMALLERETLRLIEVNPSLVRITGCDAKDLATKTVMDLLAAGPGQPGRSDLQRCAREGRALSVCVRRGESNEVPIEMTIAVVGEGEDARLLAVLRDTSDRHVVERDHEDAVRGLRDRVRRLEEAATQAADQNSNLEQANRRLTEIADRKDHYLSSVSHELRTPLTSIRSFSEILIKHGETEPAIRREFLDIIHKESERLTRLVNNVLDLARIEAGAAKLIVSEFDARGVADDAASSVQGLATERKVRVSVRPGDAARPLRADRDRIQQLLVNLLGNAIKFSDDGSEVVLEVGAGDRPDRIRYTVRDHGRGIPAADLERVFERFQRVDDGGGAGGTGLGLSICREIVTMHGGRIWAESGDDGGVGSVFHAEFPGVEESRGRNNMRPAPATTTPTAAPLPALGGRESFAASSQIRRPKDEFSTTGSLPPLGRS